MNMREKMARLNPKKSFRQFFSQWRIFDRFVSPDDQWMHPVHQGDSKMETLDYQKYQLADLEKMLASALKPVQPRTEFVKDLRLRLMDHSIPSVIPSRMPASHFALLVTGSILSGVFLVIAGSRAVATFLGALGVLSYVKTKVDGKRIATAPKRAF
jgi:hypothetical protein